MKADLTGKDLSKLPAPPKGHVIYYDCTGRGSIGGLGLRVTAKNSRSWILNYTAPDGSRRRATLGPLSNLLPLARVRGQAAKWRSETMFGEAGPLEVREERRAQALAAQTAADNAPKFAVLAEMWMKRHAAVHKRPVSQRNDAKLLRHHLNPRFGALTATAITRAMIEQMMADLSGIPIQANPSPCPLAHDP